jgi:cytoskeleton protein RodZ
MNSIGERLRQERLRRGFDLQQIAEATKINVALLEAIEANDLEKLPGIFFTRSFVRQYAHALQVDDSEFEQELNRLAGCEEVPTHENDIVPREDIEVAPVATAQNVSMKNSLPALGAFIVILAVCGVIFWLWQNTHNRGTEASETAPVEQPAPPAGEPGVTPAPAETKPAPTLPAETPSEQAAQPQAAPAETAPPDQAPEQSAIGEAEQAAAAAASSAPVRVQLRAKQAVWLRVAVDGKYLFSQTLEPGQSRAVGANGLVQLKTGNAAGLEVLWNGQPVGEIGPEGQVRNVEFRPDGFKILVPLPAKPPEPLPDDGL